MGDHDLRSALQVICELLPTGSKALAVSCEQANTFFEKRSIRWKERSVETLFLAKESEQELQPAVHSSARQAPNFESKRSLTTPWCVELDHVDLHEAERSAAESVTDTRQQGHQTDLDEMKFHRNWCCLREPFHIEAHAKPTLPSPICTDHGRETSSVSCTLS